MAEATSFSVALLSMPWALFNRPSIQIGALKAYLKKYDWIHADTFHPYLDVANSINTSTYRLISMDSWAGEALYSPLLFPEQYGQAKSLFQQRLKSMEAAHPIDDYDKLQEQIQKCLNGLIEKLQNDYHLIGFSVCFNQLFSSLVAAKLLKEHNPDCPVVFGGSSCVGKIGSSLLDNFPWVDYVIDGEGEGSLFQLCRYLSGRTSTLKQRIMAQGKTEQEDNNNEIRDLNTLPTPDYTSYFNEMGQLFKTEPFIPTLPIEFSRGCWWNKCKFCNLNLQWHHYRSKSGERCVIEVEELAAKHQCLNFTFTDNALPLKESDRFFDSMSEKNEDYRFFAEIRAITDPKKMAQYQRGGLSSIQVGIEALSTSLLKRMGKGTTTIENIATMRQSAENDIVLDGNLITQFPGSTLEEVDETLETLEFVLPYNPLISASFFLGYGSPVYAQPGAYGIRALTHHPMNKKLFPQYVLDNMQPLIKGYRGDRQYQRILWKPVSKKLGSWHAFHLKRIQSNIPPLSYRDGGSFLIIRQERKDSTVLQHRLKGASRAIYLYCTTIRTMDEIAGAFNTIPVEKIRSFLIDLTKKYLVFSEQNRYLSLAIRQK